MTQKPINSYGRSRLCAVYFSVYKLTEVSLDIELLILNVKCGKKRLENPTLTYGPIAQPVRAHA